MPLGNAEKRRERASGMMVSVRRGDAEWLKPCLGVMGVRLAGVSGIFSGGFYRFVVWLGRNGAELCPILDKFALQAAAVLCEGVPKIRGEALGETVLIEPLTQGGQIVFIAQPFRELVGQRVAGIL